jgi:hypothetical protein
MEGVEEFEEEEELSLTVEFNDPSTGSPTNDGPSGTFSPHGTIHESIHLLRRLYHPGSRTETDPKLSPESEFKPEFGQDEGGELLPHIKGIDGRWERTKALRSTVRLTSKVTV